MIMGKIRIGTRESQLAIWQATQVKELLAQHGFESELLFIKSEGDIDLVTPLYEIGVQGIFTRSLDAALLSNKIDVAVHSLKDVPAQLAKGILQAAVIKRGALNDIFVFQPKKAQGNTFLSPTMLRRKPLRNLMKIHWDTITVATSRSGEKHNGQEISASYY